MGKIKLSIVADAGCPTGFATVTHNLVQYLQDTEKYDVNILGINFDGKPNEWSKKFNIWPARVGGDFLGVGAIAEFIETTKPDTVLLFQDFFNIPLYLGELPNDQPGIVVYYPVDAPNVKGTYMLTLGVTTEVACYTRFGVKESVRGFKEGWDRIIVDATKENVNVLNKFSLHAIGGVDPITGKHVGEGEIVVSTKRVKQLMHEENYNIIPHGIDVSSFRPFNKHKCRRKFGLAQDLFIVGNIARNQPRKRLDLTIRAFAKFAKDKKNARLLLHSVRNDAGGWDLGQLSSYYDVADKVIVSHRFFSQQTATVAELNLLYNTLDVQINTGGGEGWGLPIFEGAASAIPQVVPNWSATKEIWEGSAELIDIAAVDHCTASINLMHCIIDCDHLSEILNKLYEDRNYREKVGEACQKVTTREEYMWENVGKQFDTLFEGAAGKHPVSGNVAISMKGVLELKGKSVPVINKSKKHRKKIKR